MLGRDGSNICKPSYLVASPSEGRFVIIQRDVALTGIDQGKIQHKVYHTVAQSDFNV